MAEIHPVKIEKIRSIKESLLGKGLVLVIDPEERRVIDLDLVKRCYFPPNNIDSIPNIKSDTRSDGIGLIPEAALSICDSIEGIAKISKRKLLGAGVIEVPFSGGIKFVMCIAGPLILVVLAPDSSVNTGLFKTSQIKKAAKEIAKLFIVD